MRVPSWLTARRLLAMLFVACAVGAWWVLHQPRVSVLYVWNVTMNPSERPLMYKHMVTIEQTSGRAGNIDVAVTFPQTVHVFHTWLHAPSEAHMLTCDAVSSGIKCRLGPMNGNGDFVLAVTTNSGEPPVLTAPDGIQVTSAAEQRQTPGALVAVLMLTFIMIMCTRSRVASERAIHGRHW